MRYTGFFPNPEILSSFFPMAYSLWPTPYSLFPQSASPINVNAAQSFGLPDFGIMVNIAWRNA